MYGQEEWTPLLDQESMVGMTLNEEQITAGEELVKQLDATDARVDAALWWYFPDDENWRLLLSLPSLIRQGPQSAYKKVQKALSGLGGHARISLGEVMIARQNDPLLRLLRTAIRTGPGISRVRFSKNVINGQLIDDALIYRLN